MAAGPTACPTALCCFEPGCARTGGRLSLIHISIVQVFDGTSGLGLASTSTRFTGYPMRLALAPEIVGRIFNGAGEPIDGLGPVFASRFDEINGSAINPVSRSYPRNYIRTGISSIDTLITLIRGQKLPDVYKRQEL